MFMCLTHWRKVPKTSQRAVWSAYVEGQEVRKDPTREYLDVTTRAIGQVAELERAHMNNPMHSAKSVEHFTPVDIVERSRRVLGAIDLDPASSTLANQTIRASQFHEGGSYGDGLIGHWLAYSGGGLQVPARVFLNPPGRVDGGRSLAPKFWAKLCEEYASGRVHSAVFIVFSLEQLATIQEPYALMQCPIAIPRRRIAYDHPAPDGRSVVSGGSPTHGSAIVYLPPLDDGEAARGLARFRAEFEPLGQVRV